MQVGALPGQPQGPGRAILPSLGDSLFMLHLLQEPEESCVRGPLQNGEVMARKRDERWRNCVLMVSENYLLRTSEIDSVPINL